MKIFETFLELKMISDHFFQDITIYTFETFDRTEKRLSTLSMGSFSNKMIFVLRRH